MLVFIVVDAVVQDPLWAIGAALVFVLFQTVLTFLKQHRLDPFILVDALLIGGMGAVSLLTQNELFFKLKPAILEGILVPLLLFLALANERLVFAYLGRYNFGGTGQVALSSNTLPLLRKLLAVMAVLVLVHAGIVVIAALQWSRQTWAWVSGPGFYLILIPILGWALVRRFSSQSKSEPEIHPRRTIRSRRRRK